jgi:PKD repeat protein
LLKRGVEVLAMPRRSFFVAAAVLATFACGDSGSDPASPTGPSGSGAATLNVRITDSPYGSAKAVLVTFSDVSAQRSNSGWERLPFADGSTGTWTCDLKKLQNSVQDLLGSARLDAGHYTMLRLMVQSAKIYFDNPAVSATPCARSIPEPAGAAFPLTIPSGEVKLNGQFTLSEGAATTILLDFDGESSIREAGSGNYMMTPVVRIVSVQ